VKPSLHDNPKAYLIPYPVESFSKPIVISGEGTTIGRDPKDSIHIAHAEVSRRHAIIRLEDGHFCIEDLDSQNGTYLNRKRIQRAILKNHDTITIGNRTFLFLLKSVTITDLLMDPSISASDTIALSEDEIDMTELWAQNASSAAKGFFQKAELDVDHTDVGLEQPAYSASKRLSLLYRLSEKLRVTKSADDIFAQGLDLILEAVPGADSAMIMLQSGNDGSIEVKAYKLRDSLASAKDAIPVSRTLVEWVLAERVTLVSQNVSDDMRFQDSDSIRIHNVRSIACVPMMRENKAIGALYVASRTIFNTITQEDAVFASAVANELALNLENIRLQREALKNERMAAIGLTVSNLAHNIRNLITLNQSALDLMEVHLRSIDNPQIDKNWHWIQQSFSGINKLSTGMLEYAKENDLHLKMTDINQMVMRYRKAFEHNLSREGLKFEFTLSPENPQWMMDEIQFQRAFFNLVTNAMHAIKNCKDGMIHVSIAVESNTLVVSVMDNGCGIDPDKKSRILELFFTTKGTTGTGLGLPMVQKFVEKLGGRLEFDSEWGKGSTFRMIFPKIS